MDTHFLQTFVLVSQTGSMAEAARRQGVTPAAVAQQIHALERELGAPLVARAGRTVTPTPAGYRLLERASDVLREVGEIRDGLVVAHLGAEEVLAADDAVDPAEPRFRGLGGLGHLLDVERHPVGASGDLLQQRLEQTIGQ